MPNRKEARRPRLLKTYWKRYCCIFPQLFIIQASKSQEGSEKKTVVEDINDIDVEVEDESNFEHLKGDNSEESSAKTQNRSRNSQVEGKKTDTPGEEDKNLTLEGSNSHEDQTKSIEVTPIPAEPTFEHDFEPMDELLAFFE